MFSPNANGVGAIDALPTSAPTPMALGLNDPHVSLGSHDTEHRPEIGVQKHRLIAFVT